MKQLENLSPSIMKQVLPLIEQLPPLYMDLVKGREDFTPKPEETRRLVCSISCEYSSVCARVSDRVGDLFVFPPLLCACVYACVGSRQRGMCRACICALLYSQLCMYHDYTCTFIHMAAQYTDVDTFVSQ